MTFVYKIRVCGQCRHQIDWCADDGEGMYPRGYCRGPKRHLNIDRGYGKQNDDIR